MLCSWDRPILAGSLETKMTNYKVAFQALEQAARDADYYDAEAALHDAETNANDTPNEDFYTIAYASICYTANFVEKEGVRKFFAFHGYEY
jgi:hypothetical protein